MSGNSNKKNVCLSVNDAYKKMTEGYGCQLDTHIFRPYNNYSETDIKSLVSHIKRMNLQSVRTQVFPEWYMRELGKYEFDTLEMQQLYKLLDICEENNIKVDLSIYGCNRNFVSQDGKYSGSPLANTFEGNWITAPKLHINGVPFDGYLYFADAVCELLKYVTEVKKYTCIYEYSIFPEPNCSFFNENGDCIDEEFIEFYKIVDAKVTEAGLKDRIICSGPGDCANDPERYKKYADGLKGIIKKNTSSVYKFCADSSNEEMYSYAKTLVGICARVGNTWGVCECGSNQFIDPANQRDTDAYSRAVYMGRLFINFTNAGCTNIKYWVLNDVWYGDYIMNLGLWKLKDFASRPKPQYYTWSLITKLTDFGSEIYPISSDSSSVCAVAFKLPSGERTYFIANTGEETTVEITDRHLTGGLALAVYTVTENNLSGILEPVSPEGGVSFIGGSCLVKLPENSFIALSNRK